MRRADLYQIESDNICRHAYPDDSLFKLVVKQAAWLRIASAGHCRWVHNIDINGYVTRPFQLKRVYNLGWSSFYHLQGRYNDDTITLSCLQRLYPVEHG